MSQRFKKWAPQKPNWKIQQWKKVRYLVLLCLLARFTCHVSVIRRPDVTNTISGCYALFWIFWRESFTARKKRLAARGSRLRLAGSQARGLAGSQARRLAGSQARRLAKYPPPILNAIQIFPLPSKHTNSFDNWLQVALYSVRSCSEFSRKVSPLEFQ